MEQITSALIGIGLVLAAVFGPMAFFGGSTGVIYRQFSVTIIASMLLSVVVALILTPVLCASLLKPVEPGDEPGQNAIFFLRPIFTRFDRFFFRTRDKYVNTVKRSLSNKLRYLIVYGLIVVGVGLIFLRLPTGFLPDEDQGVLFAQVMMPTGSTREQTQKVLDDIQIVFREERRGSGKVLYERRRLRLFGNGPDKRHGIRHAQRLEVPAQVIHEGKSHSGAGVEGLRGHAQRPCLRFSAAPGGRAGQRQGVLIPVARPGRRGP